MTGTKKSVAGVRRNCDCVYSASLRSSLHIVPYESRKANNSNNNNFLDDMIHFQVSNFCQVSYFV